MLKGFLPTLLCSLILIGKIQAQEVIVAREKTTEAPKPTPQDSQPVSPESPTPPPRKSKPREKKSAPARVTLEEMRAAGARAAQGPNDGSASRSMKTRQPDIESAPAPNPTVAEVPRPVKRQTPVEQRNPSRPTKPRTTTLDEIGPVRPTMMESGREPPSPSPSGR
jgi:hypothetical protein